MVEVHFLAGFFILLVFAGFCKSLFQAENMFPSVSLRFFLLHAMIIYSPLLFSPQAQGFVEQGTGAQEHPNKIINYRGAHVSGCTEAYLSLHAD